MFGIALTIGVELWAVAAGVQAVQNMFSGTSDRQYDYSPPTTTYTSNADLSRCGNASSGFSEEERDPALKKACDEDRKRQRNQKVIQRCVEECAKLTVTGGE
jgi:hypothetical protein